MNILSSILEKWAEVYLPISHDPMKGSKQKAYYEIKAIDSSSEFVRNVNTAKSPCMAYSVLVDARVQGSKGVNYSHTVYFLSKAKSFGLAKTAKQDDDLGADVQLQMDGYVQDLLAFLFELKRSGVNPLTGEQYDRPTMEALRGLDLEHAEWASVPVKYNEWHIMGLQVEQIAPRLLCVNPQKYNLNV